MKLTKTLILFLAGLILAACASGSNNSSGDNANEGFSAALPATRVPTATPPLPPPTDPPSPDTTIRGQINSGQLNLRVGPSTLYPIIRTYFEGEEVIATGRVPEGDWLRVEVGESHETGWMSTAYLQLNRQVEDLSVVDIPQRQTLRGNVLDSLGDPISNVVVAAILRGEDETQRTETTSNEKGEFTLYIPKEMIDQILSIEAIGPNCGSRIMNADCTQIEYFEVQDQHYITPPHNEPITFIYEKSTATIIGKVITRGGWAIHGIVVFASRESDQADAQTLTNDKGEYTLAVGEGDWRIVAIRFIPYLPGLESEPAFVTLAPGDLTEPIYIITPWQKP